jgi:phosphate transport system permease protein
MDRRRKLEAGVFHFFMVASACIMAAVLGYIILTVLVKGLPALSLDMITKTPKGGYYIGKEGGILNAISGSLVLGMGSTLIALAMSLPVVVYLHLYLKRRSRFALIVRFTLDVLWGIPSIVYGAFGFTLMVFFGLRASLIAGMITVALLIFPIITRGIDEAFKMIPFELEQACFALGSTRLETAMNVIIRQAMPGIITASLIGFGRGIGDAASVLFTAGFTDSLPGSIFKPVATLPLAIFFQLGTPFPEVRQRGYASALILTAIILCVSVLSRMLSKRFNRNIIK